jgi:hypothetical protein
MHLGLLFWGRLDINPLHPCRIKLNPLEVFALLPTTDVLSMIRLVLENKNFSFNGKHYLQVEGTAIGSRLGMNYASTYLG